MELPIENIKNMFCKHDKSREAEWECEVESCKDSFIPEGFDFDFLQKL